MLITTKRALKLTAGIGLAGLMWCAKAAEPEGAPFEVVPEPPPLPAQVQSGEVLEPDVRIVPGERETIHEYRFNGRLYAVRVVPNDSRFPPYYLVDADGDGQMDVRRNALAPPFLIPQWVLFSW